MPTYDYRCAKCGEELEVFQTFAEKPLTKHAGCGGKLAKVLSPAGIVLKGSGFYKNDSRSGGKRSNGSSAKSEPSTSETSTKSDTSKADSSSSSSKSDSSKSSDSGTKKKSEPSTSSAKSS